jgi:hypothetical protein
VEQRGGDHGGRVVDNIGFSPTTPKKIQSAANPNMTRKKVVIDTDRKRGQLFYVNEHNGHFYIYDIDVGVVFNDQKKIGEARSLSDAIEIIKASVSGSVRNVRIE